MKLSKHTDVTDLLLEQFLSLEILLSMKTISLPLCTLLHLSPLPSRLMSPLPLARRSPGLCRHHRSPPLRRLYKLIGHSSLKILNHSLRLLQLSVNPHRQTFMTRPQRHCLLRPLLHFADQTAFKNSLATCRTLQPASNSTPPSLHRSFPPNPLHTNRLTTTTIGRLLWKQKSRPLTTTQHGHWWNFHRGKKRYPLAGFTN